MSSTMMMVRSAQCPISSDSKAAASIIQAIGPQKKSRNFSRLPASLSTSSLRPYFSMRAFASVEVSPLVEVPSAL
jgi:hypothetical protein